jgi:hypothetical protein
MSVHPGHIPSLGGLRACSILIVLLSHFVNAHVIPGGLGVYAFFVTSGVLITRLFIGEQKKSGRISLANFYLPNIRLTRGSSDRLPGNRLQGAFLRDIKHRPCSAMARTSSNSMLR